MPGQKTLRRRQPQTTPFLPAPIFGSIGVPSLSEAMEQLTTRADEMMRSTFGEFGELKPIRFPAMNVSENKDEFTVTAELPGLEPEDVTVNYMDGVLTIRGEKEREESREEDDRTFYLWERRFGSFQRSLPLPGGIEEDKISAAFKNGVLHVHLPKAEETRKHERKIPVTNG